MNICHDMLLCQHVYASGGIGFLARLSFSQTKSVTQFIRSGYGEKSIKSVPKFKKLEYRLTAVELNLTFSMKCKCANVSPNFLSFWNACFFIKKRLQHRCFPVKFAKSLTTSFFCRKLPMATSAKEIQIYKFWKGNLKLLARNE